MISRQFISLVFFSCGQIFPADIYFFPFTTYRPLRWLIMRSGPFFPYLIKYPTHHSVPVNVTVPSYTYSEYIIHIATF